MNDKKLTLTLTGIIIPDKKAQMFTAYLAEFPEDVADGATNDNAAENLIEAP